MVTQLEQKIESTFSKVIRLLRWNKPEGRLILMIPGLWAVGGISRSTRKTPFTVSRSNHFRYSRYKCAWLCC